jgi:hypothetical protein
MEEERIVRLATLSRRGGSDRGGSDRAGRFALVHAACEEVVQTLLPNCLTTLLLLDARDVANGLLESLIGFPRKGTQTEISGAGLDLDAEDKPLVLAICMSQPSLEAWERSEWLGSESIKEQEFLIHLAESYRLAIVIGGINVDSIDEISARIRRSLNAVSSWGSWKQRCEWLRRDVAVLLQRAAGILGEKLFASHVDPTTSEGIGRYLRIVSRLDQFGKRPIANITAGINNDFKSIPILKKYIGGSYGLRRAISHAIRQNDTEHRAPRLPSSLRVLSRLRQVAR